MARVAVVWLLFFTGLSLLTVAVLHSAPEAQRRLDRAVERWQQHGGVRSTDALRPALAPGADNAAEGYLRAIEHLSAVRDDEREHALRHPQRATTMQMQRWLADEAVALALAREAAMIETCRWPHPHVDRTTGGRAGHVPGMVKLARLLGVEAQLRGRQGDGPAAVQAIEVLWRLAGHLGTEPGAIAATMHLHEDNRALMALETAFAHTPPPADAALAELLARRDYRALVGRAAIGEAALVLELFDAGELGDVEGVLGRIGPGGVHEPRRLKEDVALMLESLGGRFEQWGRPFHEQSVLEVRSLPRSMPVSFETMLVLEQVNRIAARVEARRALAVIALRLSEHHRKHGALPDRLEQVPGLSRWLVDPINGRRVVYQVEGDGSFLLSVDAAALDMDDVTWRWSHR